MELFDKKFVYLEWDDVLEGKEVFLADSLTVLKRAVMLGEDRLSVEENDGDYPFTSPAGVHYSMAYYDPTYECKRAFLEGKEVECLDGFGNWILMTPTDPWFDDRRSYRVKPEMCKLYVHKCLDGTLYIGKYADYCFLFDGTDEECRQYIKEHYCDRCVHQSCTMEAGTQFCKGFKEPRQKRRMTNRELSRWLAEGNGECICDDISMSCWRYVCDEADVLVEDGVLIRRWDEAIWCKPEVEDAVEEEVEE